MNFQHAEQALIKAIHRLEDRADVIEERGLAHEKLQIPKLRKMAADGKAALFVLQQVIGKWNDPNVGVTVERQQAA